jgi:hypothetical protein
MTAGSREEAVMATITFNTAHQKALVRKLPDAALAACRDILDAFVSNRMRHTATEAEHARPRQSSGKRSPSKDAQ